MQQRTSSQARGFTIIEVMIVLAIAGMILLIIFQAIPTVTRNARNGNRKQDASAILGAVSHYELNHSGNFPDSTSNFLQFTKLSYYDPVVEYDPSGALNADTNIVIYSKSASFKPDSNLAATVDGKVDPVTNKSLVAIYKYQRCNTSDNGGSSSVGAGYYNTVALYSIETASGISSQCEQL